MSKSKKLRDARNYTVLPEQIEIMARFLHDINGYNCSTIWEKQDRAIKTRYKGRVILMLTEAGFTVEGVQP